MKCCNNLKLDFKYCPYCGKKIIKKSLFDIQKESVIFTSTENSERFYVNEL